MQYILTGNRSSGCNPDKVAQEVVGAMYVVETILERERKDVSLKMKADIVYSAFMKSTPEERQAMLRALDEGVFTIPYTVAKLFGMSANNR